jgi:PAS domain S-box-containing protein
MAADQKILIVDDKEENLFVLERLLRETGAEIIPAGNGNDALTASLNHDFSLAILDVQMPDMDGYELAQYLRGEEKTKDLPIIFLSAVYSDEDHVFKGFESGAVDFITKPYNPEIFLSKVNIFLHRERLLQEHKRTEEELFRHREHLEKLVRERTIELEERAALLLEEINERKRVQEINQLLASIVGSSNDAIIGTTLDGIISSWNRGAQKIYGYAFNEIIGNPISKIIPSSCGDEWKVFLEKVKAGTSIEHYETQRKRKDGMLIDVALTISPISNISGEIIGASTIARDITKHKHLEKQIQQLQKMEALGRFAGGIAHDLNNVLYPIIIDIELLLEETASSTRIHRTLTKVLKAAHRQRDLIRQILSFSRRSEQKIDPIKVTPVLEETIDLLRSSLPTTIRIEKHIDVHDDNILGDPTQIQQIILNLFKNAADAIGSKNGTIEVRLENIHIEPVVHPELKAGQYLTLMVKDTGHGMTPELMDKIFEPFFTTKEVRKGTGMGLAVVHGIIKNHGGTITVESEPGKGSVFTVFLPVNMENIRKQSQSYKALPKNGKGKVLLVDDEEIILSSIRNALNRLGYDVMATRDAVQALEFFKKTPGMFNLVITDLTMPQITGVELAEKLMELQADIPVILCTGYSDAINEDEAKAMGIRELLLKPSTMNELNAVIHRALEHNQEVQ